MQELQRDIYSTAVEKGWWAQDRQFLEVCALIHSEISEAVEAWREDQGAIFINENGKPEGYIVELADAIIRIMDVCGHMGIDILDVVKMKHEYNKTRPYRHGGKRA